MSRVARITTRLSRTPIQEAAGPLAQALHQLRRRVLALGAGAALGWCWVVALVILLVFAWADFDLILGLGVVRRGKNGRSAKKFGDRVEQMIQHGAARLPCRHFLAALDELALRRRYGLAPFRYKRQRYTTLMVRVPKAEWSW